MKLLLITSEYTGHGHKSISTALMEQFSRHPDVEVDVVDGFSWIGEIGIRMSKVYGPVTRRARELWRMAYSLADKSASTVSEILAALIREKFSDYIRTHRPDVIVTVHPMFNGSVIDVLEEMGLEIPVIAHQADLISIHSTWCDPRCYRTLCLTPEAQEVTIRQGVPASRAALGSFPTRQVFCQAALSDTRPPYAGERPLRCLIASGGEGSGNLLQYAQRLLNHFDCSVTVLCGRNMRLKKNLEEELGSYQDRLTVLGFVNNVQDYILDADLMVARGSPNTMMEAVVCATPLIITGALPGQEEKNPDLFSRHGLGVVCESPRDMVETVRRLVAGQAEGLAKIRAAQKAYRNLDSAKNNVDYIIRTCEEYMRERG